MTLRDLTKELYDWMYEDPLNYMQRMFPPWESLPESAKKHWDKEILKIRNTKID